MTLLVNRTRLERVTPPLVEPVTLAEAKTYLGQDLDHHDDLIRSLIAAARDALETTYGVAFMPQVWDQAVTWVSATDAPPVRLLRTPVQEIVSVTYVESATGLEVLLPRAAVLRVRGGVRVIVPDGVSLPTAYVMRFVAGSGRYAAGDMDLSPGTNTITRVTGSFVADGFVVGDTIYTSRQNNRGPFTVQAVDALTLTTVENLSGPPGEEATLIASASGVPEALRVGLLAFTAWLYEHRGDELAPVPAHIDRLVRIYGVPETP